MKKLTLLLALALVAGACTTGQAASTTGFVDSGGAEELMQTETELVVLDVRTPEEFAAGTLPGAILIDINSPSFADDVAALDRGVPYLVFCRSGNRSANAVRIMEDLRFDEIYELENGIQAWVASGRALAAG